MRTCESACALLFAFMLAPTLRLAAADTVLWEIGRFDQSSSEFHGRVDYSDPDRLPIYTVGQSEAKDWPAHQPGSQNKDTGAHAFPYTVLFNLADKPKGAYRLTVAVQLTRSRVPSLLVEINGRSGLFYFHRKISYYPGDGGVDSPIYGSDQIEIPLPTSALLLGENKLVLTAWDDPKDGEGDSWLNYDALRLSQNPTEKHAYVPQATVEPTIYYVQKEGKLLELTDVTVTLGDKVRKGEVILITGGNTYRSELAGLRDFGQQRVQFSIPELTQNTPGQVTIRLNGKTYRSQVTLEPRRKWTLYVVPHAHLDIGFTDYQAKVAEVHNRNIDKLIDEIREFPEMRFSLDGSWIAQQYLATRNATARGDLLQLLRESKMALPAQYANLLTGYPTLEELIRSTDYSYRIHQEAGVPFEYANITDIPAYSWSYASVLSALGIKYFAAAANSDRAPILLYGRWNEKSPFWWQGPDGGKVLMAYTRQYFQFSFVCGVPAQEAACRQSLPTFFQAFDSPSYKPDTILMFGSQVENTDLIPGEPQFVRAWNAHYAYPKMVLATFPDYFHYIDQHYGSSLETVVGDLGPYWEDGLGTDSWYGAINRANQQRATSAEKLSTISAFWQKKVAGPAEQIRRMWDDLILYAEHTFTSWGGYSRPESEESVRQLATHDHFAIDGRERVNAIIDQSLSQLADQIHVPSTAIIVFNPSSWTRSGLVETDIDANRVIRAYPDRTEIPVEVLRHQPDYDHVRFMARDVPSLGYRCYQITSRRRPETRVERESEIPPGNTLENEFYRLEMDPAQGAIKSLFDKQLNRELVDLSSPYLLNQYIYVAGGDETATQLVYLRKSLPLAKLTVSKAGDGRVVSRRKTAFGQTLTYQARGLHAPSIETEIILYDNEKKIEFINRFHKEPVFNKEAVYFAFPFAVKEPTFSYEIQNGWVDPSRDAWKGSNKEWFTVQHWVKVAGPDCAVGLVPVDAPLVTFGDIDRGVWPEQFEPRSSTVFSWVMNNYWHTDFRRVQMGDYTFRYALTSGRELTPEALTRFGRAVMTPLELGQLISNDKFGNPEAPLTPAPASFLKVDAPNVVVENWKAAEDGHGTILRLLEIGGREADARLDFPFFDLGKAWLADAREENKQEIPVTRNSLDLKLKPHQILSVRILATRRTM